MGLLFQRPYSAIKVTGEPDGQSLQTLWPGLKQHLLSLPALRTSIAILFQRLTGWRLKSNPSPLTRLPPLVKIGG